MVEGEGWRLMGETALGRTSAGPPGFSEKHLEVYRNICIHLNLGNTHTSAVVSAKTISDPSDDQVLEKGKLLQQMMPRDVQQMILAVHALVLLADSSHHWCHQTL